MSVESNTDPVSVELKPLLVPQDLAARYGVSRRYVLDRVREHEWPHIKVGRQVRFDVDQVRAIDRMRSVEPEVPAEQEQAESWGRRTRAS